MTYDLHSHKIVGIISSKAEPHVALNVIGHLGIALGSHVDKALLMGRDILTDASGMEHFGIARYGFVIKSARPSKIAQAIQKARESENIIVADYPRAILETGHDDELAEAISSTQEEALDYMGVLLFGPTEEIDAICGHYTLWSWKES